MLVVINDNEFKGENIATLEPDSKVLAESWTLKLATGKELKLKVDWRGEDAYIGLYDESK